MGVIFITGIDTDTGKTMVTGLLARYLLKNDKSVITQKVVQTGCNNLSNDILTHRKIMGIEPTDDDKNGLTCPYVFKYPASPHLASKLENITIDTEKITDATDKLLEKYDTVLLEGVGGLYVPLNDEITLIDYIEIHNYPIIIVANAKLGSINHTLLTLEAALKRDIHIHGIIYNHYPMQEKTIADDSRDVFERFLSQQWFDASIIDIPEFDMNAVPDIDFGRLINIF